LIIVDFNLVLARDLLSDNFYFLEVASGIDGKDAECLNCRSITFDFHFELQICLIVEDPNRNLPV